MRRPAVWVAVALIALGLVRIAAAVWAAVWNIRGDYYASLPGAYVQNVNPALWDSADLASAWGYHANTYFHGPTQYLTLYAVAFLDSYAAIAQVLLPLYAAALAAGFLLLRGAIARLIPIDLTAPLFASTFLFFPLLQAFIQREFEVVVFVALAGALWLLVDDRRSAAAALLGYISWFKYVPLLFAGYLGLRGWWRAVGAFGLTSLIILATAHLVFGLELFVNNNVPGHAAQVFNVFSYGFQRGQHQYFYGTGFCYGWIEIETTLANVRHGLCSLSFRAPWFPSHIVYLAICLLVAVTYLIAHARLERLAPLPLAVERWRRALEFAVVTTVYSCFFFNHYYYLIVLAIPFAVLLARYTTIPFGARHGAWALAYMSISAFVIPTSVLTAATGIDVWSAYIKGAWFLWGELLLIALLLNEYWRLPFQTGQFVTPPVQNPQH